MDFLKLLVYNYLDYSRTNGGKKMKNIKRLLSVMLIFVLAFSFAGCHKKGETAVTIGEWKFTSAYYMCAFLQANDQAKAIVQQGLTEEESANADFDYTTKKVEKKEYQTWVRDTAIETIKKIAALKTLCKQNDIVVEQETKDSYAEMINSVWEDANNGYYYASYFGDQLDYGVSLAQKYEENGVSKTTYCDFVADKALSDLYFDHIYGAKGEKAIPQADIDKEFYDNYVIADVLDATFSENATDKEKKDLKEKLDGYAAKIKSGKTTFEKVYNEYNKIEAKDKVAHDHDGDGVADHDAKDHEPNSTPKDELAQLLGSEKSASPNDNYKTVKEMKIGEVKVVENGETGYILLVKKDIKKDKYYVTQNDVVIRHALKDEEFSKTIEDFVKTLKVDVNDFAVDQFEVDEIKKPTE